MVFKTWDVAGDLSSTLTVTHDSDLEFKCIFFFFAWYHIERGAVLSPAPLPEKFANYNTELNAG